MTIFIKLIFLVVTTLIITGCDSEAKIIYKEEPEWYSIDESLYRSCPSDMKAIGKICIDIYEASKADATEILEGVNNSIAISAQNRQPWRVNPINMEAVNMFDSACKAVGKRLCKAEEWYFACATDEHNNYFFGDIFDSKICNSVDTYCEDYCIKNSISLEECNISENCGYKYYCFSIQPTGVFPNCTNKYGFYDVNGNVWETVLSENDPRGFEIKGGAFNCASPSSRFNCMFNASWSQLYAGFRCCKDRDKK